MRKANKGRKLSRLKNQRVAVLRTLATSLFMYEKITTTEAKAKELRPVAEKMITRARTNSVANRRVLGAQISPVTLKKLMDEIAPKYVKRQGGYTKITKMGPRKTDGARMAVIELVK